MSTLTKVSDIVKSILSDKWQVETNMADYTDNLYIVGKIKIDREVLVKEDAAKAVITNVVDLFQGTYLVKNGILEMQKQIDDLVTEKDELLKEIQELNKFKTYYDLQMKMTHGMTEDEK